MIKQITPAIAIICGLIAALLHIKGWFIFVALAYAIALISSLE